jgi:hypothetical protein
MGERTIRQPQISFSQGQSGVAERLRQIRSMKNASEQAAGGKTAHFDSLLVGLQLLETPTFADSLYLISDGADNASHAHFNDIAQRLSSSGVRLFVSLSVGHSGNRSPTPEEESPIEWCLVKGTKNVTSYFKTLRKVIMKQAI